MPSLSLPPTVPFFAAAFAGRFRRTPAVSAVVVAANLFLSSRSICSTASIRLSHPHMVAHIGFTRLGFRCGRPPRRRRWSGALVRSSPSPAVLSHAALPPGRRSRASDARPCRWDDTVSGWEEKAAAAVSIYYLRRHGRRRSGLDEIPGASFLTMLRPAPPQLKVDKLDLIDLCGTSSSDFTTVMVGSKQAFDVSLADVSQTQMQGKTDVLLSSINEVYNMSANQKGNKVEWHGNQFKTWIRSSETKDNKTVRAFSFNRKPTITIPCNRSSWNATQFIDYIPSHSLCREARRYKKFKAPQTEEWIVRGMQAAPAAYSTSENLKSIVSREQPCRHPLPDDHHA